MATHPSPFADNDGKYPTRPEWSMGGNIDKLKEPDYGMDGAGNSTLTNLDEREIGEDTVAAVNCTYAMPDTDPEWFGNRQGVYANGA